MNPITLIISLSRRRKNVLLFRRHLCIAFSLLFALFFFSFKLLKNFTTIISKTRVFSIKLSLAPKNEKIQLFILFLLKALTFRCLSHFKAKKTVFERVLDLVKLQRRHFCTPTEPLLALNGVSVALQKCHKRTLKVPLLKTNER